jgi:hypothetical protein
MGLEQTIRKYLVNNTVFVKFATIVKLCNGSETRAIQTLNGLRLRGRIQIERKGDGLILEVAGPDTRRSNQKEEENG